MEPEDPSASRDREPRDERAPRASRAAAATELASKKRPEFSRLFARGRVGVDFFARAGAIRPGVAAPPGLVDALADLARPGVDVARMHPDVVPFFLAPGALELRIESRWHHAFAFVWWLLRPLMRWLGQLCLPRGASASASTVRVHVRTVALDPALDGRADVRGVVRSYADDGAAMQVMAYATFRAGDARYMSAAFPLPWAALCGVLRLDLLEAGEAGSRGVGARLTTARYGADARGSAGVWLAPAVGPAVRLPLGETLCLWGADDAGAPRELRAAARADEVCVGLHEQRLFGLLFATHRYWFRPRG